MKKYAMTLLPFIAVAFLTGCDSNCCGNPEVKKTSSSPNNNPPVAKIGNYADNTVIECTPGETIQLTNNSSDPDNNLDNTQTVWNTTDGTGNVTCPADGQTLQVCLTVTDQEGMNDQSCVTLKGQTLSQLQPPYIELQRGFKDYDSIGFVECKEIKDQDTVDSNNQDDPYGSDKAIKEIYWKIIYNDNSIHNISQTDWNNQDPKFSNGDCGKWLDDSKLPATIVVTPVDDDDQNKTFTYRMDVNGDISPVVE